MKKIEFEADFLLDVINQFSDWKAKNEVSIYSVKQIFSVDVPCKMIAWYIINE